LSYFYFSYFSIPSLLFTKPALEQLTHFGYHVINGETKMLERYFRWRRLSKTIQSNHGAFKAHVF